MNKYPDYYKFGSWELNMHKDRINWNRQTYSLLDWLGDLGGLIDALVYLSKAIVASLSGHSLRVNLTKSFVKVRKQSKSTKYSGNR